MKFVGVREFKQEAVKYLNEGSEIDMGSFQNTLIIPPRDFESLFVD